MSRNADGADRRVGSLEGEEPAQEGHQVSSQQHQHPVLRRSERLLARCAGQPCPALSSLLHTDSGDAWETRQWDGDMGGEGLPGINAAPLPVADPGPMAPRPVTGSLRPSCISSTPATELPHPRVMPEDAVAAAAAGPSPPRVVLTLAATSSQALSGLPLHTCLGQGQEPAATSLACTAVGPSAPQDSAAASPRVAVADAAAARTVPLAAAEAAELTVDAAAARTVLPAAADTAEPLVEMQQRLAPLRVAVACEVLQPDAPSEQSSALVEHLSLM